MSQEELNQRRAWLVSGRVQGVGFRWCAVREADRLGLTGAVWNEPDGRVEVHARGPADALDAFEAWLGVGPPMASVDAVVEVPPDAPAEGESFEVRDPRTRR